MTTAVLLGHRTPRISWVPPYVSSAGQEAIDLAATAGLILDPWQQDCLVDGLGERPDGRWQAFEVGIVVSRQNGKGSIFEARCLAGLFLFGEQLILYSAHEFKTAQEMFLRIKSRIDNTDAFRRRVKRVRTSHGEEGIELIARPGKEPQRLRFVARSTGSGRGFSGDVNIMDEAFNLPSVAVDALMPTMSARPNPQLWYGSSAADKKIAPCEQLARVRRRGIKGGDLSLVYKEWSIDPHTKKCARDEVGQILCTDHDDRDSPLSVAKANPALPHRISLEHTERERASMGVEGYDRERLGVGDWPVDEADQWNVIPEDVWRTVTDPASQMVGRVAMAIRVAPNRSWAAIAAGGRRPDGLLHAEVIDYRAGTKWAIKRARELKERWNPCALVVDAGSPAGSLIADLEAPWTDEDDQDHPGLEVVKPTAREVAHAYGQFVDAVMPKTGEPTVRVRPHPALDAAVAGAAERRLGDAKAWDARTPDVDASTLEAITDALWGFTTRGHVEEAETEPWAVFE